MYTTTLLTIFALFASAAGHTGTRAEITVENGAGVASVEATGSIESEIEDASCQISCPRGNGGITCVTGQQCDCWCNSSGSPLCACR